MSWYLSVFWIVILSFTLTSFFLFKFMQSNALKTFCMNAMRSSQKHKYSFFEFTCTILRLTSGLALYRKKDSSYPWFVGLMIIIINCTLFRILKFNLKTSKSSVSYVDLSREALHSLIMLNNGSKKYFLGIFKEVCNRGVACSLLMAADKPRPLLQNSLSDCP